MLMPEVCYEFAFANSMIRSGILYKGFSVD
jgi:hypothetical protein